MLVWLTGDESAANIILARDSGEAVRKAKFVASSGQADSIVFFDNRGTDIVTGKFAEPEDTVPLVLRGQPVNDKLLSASRFTLVVGIPISSKGRLIGGVIATRELGTEKALDAYKKKARQRRFVFFRDEAGYDLSGGCERQSRRRHEP